ncbi:MAG: T9SS type A sorting domain-containing protein [Clostridia bacterium]|nr:T9SS type A sorting domain-containing protein [Clostridia bacterium]
MVKKYSFLILTIIISNLFASVINIDRDTIDNTDNNNIFSENEEFWYSYYSEAYYLWQLEEERSVLIKADDFGFEYPVNLKGISSYFFDKGYYYSYRIYSKDGKTIIWNSENMTSISNYNDFVMDEPIMVTDDFYIAVVPDHNGMPRQTSSKVTSSDHSYTKEITGWIPFISESERYEWVMNVYMLPNEESDTFPPIVRSLSGNENFIDTDADLELTVQDKSTVLSPINAEYTLDGGITWTAFTMTSSKSNYLFSGTIPGQADGSAGSVKFYLEDNFSNAQWSDEYPILWSKDKLLLSESFEGETFPPEDWTLQSMDSTGIGFSRVDIEYYENASHTGVYSAFHSDGDIMNFNDDWLITPMINIPLENSVTLSFWELGYYLMYVADGKHEICVSSDKLNWDVIYTEYPPLGEIGNGEEWGNSTLALHDYAGESIYIGFHYVGNYEDQWYIDDVKLFFDYEGPVISKIASNEAIVPNIGAFVNNDMILDLTVSDNTEVDTVTGHYSFDGGSTFTDLVFSNSKFIEAKWVGVIPALPVETAGVINFTLTDTGGNVTDTDQYDIYFVEDNEVAEVERFEYRSPVFVNDDHAMSVTFNDESAIDSCRAYYSKDSWVTQTEIPMAASKYHSYTYTGSIPAETSETFGKVKFIITDTSGNTLNSEEYEVKWLEGSIIYFDDFDDNHIFADWNYIGGNWGYNTSSYYSPVKSISDSPSGNYYNNTTNYMQSKEFDLSSLMGGKIYFWASIDLEDSFDHFYIEATIDSGATWTKLASFTGYHPEWQYYSVDIGSVVANPGVKFKFTVKADEYVNGNGVSLDDFMIAGYSKDYSAPLITYTGPEELVIGLTDYNFEVGVLDISNLSELKVVYKVDGGAEQYSYSDLSSVSNGIYNVYIPAVQPGAKIEYKIAAVDSSEFLNFSETEYFEVYSGNYLYYENGMQYADFYDIIGNSSQATAYAIAKRITMGPLTGKGHYKADLLGLTIGNYTSTDNPNAPMNIHIWTDAGGFPGEDIVSPIYVVPGSNIADPDKKTIVDLRPYSADLSDLEGDIFVGFTSAGDGTNILYEVAENHITEPGYVQFRRSWLGNGNETGVSWVMDEGDVYHISAITSAYTLMDSPLAPLNLTGRGGEGNVILEWAEGVDDDIDFYNIYRGDSENFTVGAPIATVLFSEGTTFVDPDPEGGDTEGYFYYKITAVDVDSNESGLSNEVKVNPSGIDEYLPLVTELHQNYPNPFNPVTKINFSTAENGKVSLNVYNSKGELVSKLIESDLQRGYHSIDFNGSMFVSGVYYYVLATSNDTFSSKMVLLK